MASYSFYSPTFIKHVNSASLMQKGEGNYTKACQVVWRCWMGIWKCNYLRRHHRDVLIWCMLHLSLIQWVRLLFWLSLISCYVFCISWLLLKV